MRKIPENEKSSLNDKTMIQLTDEKAVGDYLLAKELVQASDTIEIRFLSGGVSNRTIEIIRPQKPDWVLKQALSRLNVAVDWFCEPERIQTEAKALRWLQDHIGINTVPGVVFEDLSNHVLIMEAVPRPHVNWKDLLLQGEIRFIHVEKFAELLGLIHRRSEENQKETAKAFEERKFFEDLRLEPYYAYSAERAPEAEMFLRRLIEDTRQRRICLVHGDYSPKNILIHQDRLVLLDHEVAHFGDPAFDLGFALTHFLSKANHLAGHRSRFLLAANLFWSIYRTTLGDIKKCDELEPYAVRHTMGCMLARVAGRSPLEYLSADERALQQKIVVKLIESGTADFDLLFGSYAKLLQQG